MNQSSHIDYITIVQYKPRLKAKSVLLMNLKLPYTVSQYIYIYIFIYIDYSGEPMLLVNYFLP